jgi:hypothetical protein
MDDRKIGTGFTNIGKILQANAGNRLGQVVGGRIQQAGTQAQQQLAQSTSEFENKTKGASSQLEENKKFKENIMGRINQPVSDTSVPTSVPEINKTEISPTKPNTTPELYTPSDEDIRRAEQIRQGIYQGPSGLNNLENIKASVQRAQTLGQETRTGSGRQDLLRQTVGSPSYTRGQSRLDTLLLGQRNNAQQLAQAAQSTQAVGQQTSEAAKQAELKAQTLGTQVKNLGQQFTNELGQSLGNVDQNIAQQYEAAKKYESDRANIYNKIKEFGTGKTSDLAYKEQDAQGKDIFKYDQQGNIIGTTNKADEARLVRNEFNDVIGVKDKLGNVIQKEIGAKDPVENLQAFHDYMIKSGISSDEAEQLFGKNFTQDFDTYKQKLENLKKFDEMMDKARFGYQWKPTVGAGDARYGYAADMINQLTPDEIKTLHSLGINTRTTRGEGDDFLNFVSGNSFYNNYLDNLSSGIRNDVSKLAGLSGQFLANNLGISKDFSTDRRAPTGLGVPTVGTNQATLNLPDYKNFYNAVAESLKSASTNDINQYQNLTRQAVATPEERARFTAIQRLLGKKGTDVTYNPNSPVYKRGVVAIDPTKIKV